MNPSPSDPRPLDEQAAEWLFEREAGFTPERAAEFAAWCRNPQHAQAVADAEQTLALLDELPAVRDRLEPRLHAPPAPTTPRRRLISFPALVCATGLAAAIVAAWFTWTRPDFQPPQADHYVTDRSAQRSLALPDGSVVDLNVGSAVSVQFTANERHVTLTRGEAHFQVAHDATKPFIVTAGAFSVRAVGTAFNVRLAARAVDVLVVEGKVRLGGSNHDTTSATAVAAPMVEAGERAQLSREDRTAAPRIEKVDASAIRALLTWENPMTSFSDVPLRDVITRFNRRNVTQLVLQDRELGDRKIGGMIALDQVDAFVRLLEQDGDIAVVREPTGTIGLRRAR